MLGDTYWLMYWYGRPRHTLTRSSPPNRAGRPAPTIQDSSDVSILEPGGNCTGMGEIKIRSP